MAATMAVHGLPAGWYLTTNSAHERRVLEAVTRRAVEVREVLDQQLAFHIIDTLAKAMRR